MNSLIIGINLGDDGSTGNMMIDALKFASDNGPFDCLIMTPQRSDRLCCIPFGERCLSLVQRAIEHYSRRWGLWIDGDFFASRSRKILAVIRSLRKERESIIIHLHNLHNAWLDVPLLLNGLVKMKVPLLYTLHDCWSFTGGCYHFESVNCIQYQTGCKHCPLGFKLVSARQKRKIKPLLRSRHLLLLPVSEWLGKQLSTSALSCLPRRVVYGETPFIPKIRDRSLRKQFGFLEDEVLLISVAKGLPHLKRLAELLPDNYRLIVVGSAPFDITSTRVVMTGQLDHEALAVYFSLADCFVSCTPDEALGLVIAEAQMAGLPVAGFGHGGTPEAISKKSGIMVQDDNVQALYEAILWIVTEHPFTEEDIVRSGMRFRKGEYGKRMFPIYIESARISK